VKSGIVDEMRAFQGALNMRGILLAAAIAIVPLCQGSAAYAAEVKLFGGGHFQASGQPLAEAFSKKTGIAALYLRGNTGGPGGATVAGQIASLAAKIKAGEDIDVVVMNRDEINDEIKAGIVSADSVVDFAQDSMGLAVLKGSPRPDISTPEKLKLTLLAAKAVGMQWADDRGHSGKANREILTKLGIYDEVLKKSVHIANPSADLISGKADISFWAYPELLEQPKLDVLGPVPAELGGHTTQSIGILTSSKDAADAKRFIQFVSSADGMAVWSKTGMQPLPGKKAN
jgi:molybdate transport system substrate-binding protein